MKRAAFLFVFIISGALSSPVFSAGPLDVLDPPATKEEHALFREKATDPESVRKFLATRSYLRKVKEGEKPPRLTKDVDIKYVLNPVEEEKLFSILMTQLGEATDAKKKGGKKE